MQKYSINLSLNSALCKKTETIIEFEESHVLIAFVTYLVAIDGCGLTTIAIMDIAMEKDRSSALIFASEALLGSLVWSLLAILGCSITLNLWQPSLMS
jgi:threonine/homoserine/homoserine lactone efflux protein